MFESILISMPLFLTWHMFSSASARRVSWCVHLSKEDAVLRELNSPWSSKKGISVAFRKGLVSRWSWDFVFPGGVDKIFPRDKSKIKIFRNVLHICVDVPLQSSCVQWDRRKEQWVEKSAQACLKGPKGERCGLLNLSQTEAGNVKIRKKAMLLLLKRTSD